MSGNSLTFSGGNTIFSGGNVGIGVLNPTERLMVSGNVSINGAIIDNMGSQGTAGQVLTATATGFEWQNPTSCVIGGAKVTNNGSTVERYGIVSSVSRTNTGRYRVHFSHALNTSEYYAHVSKEETISLRDDVNIDVSSYNTNNLNIVIHEGDNGNATGAYRDRNFTVTLFDSNCTALSQLANSDRRLKKDIEKIDSEDALERVLRLQGVHYEWDTKHHPYKMGLDDKPEIGLIAQDVKDVVPEVVEKGSDGYFVLDYSKLVALVIESIKEIWHKITDNTEEIEVLKQQNATLEQRLEALEQRMQQQYSDESDDASSASENAGGDATDDSSASDDSDATQPENDDVSQQDSDGDNSVQQSDVDGDDQGQSGDSVSDDGDDADNADTASAGDEEENTDDSADDTTEGDNGTGDTADNVTDTQQDDNADDSAHGATGDNPNQDTDSTQNQQGEATN